ncbi:MAG: zinc ABC transporter substrate-binding protein [Marinosulfonomonas sp.]|nr:zinc ABC transporter substrate-binding protein [Marinosulfonomonas sp.]
MLRILSIFLLLITGPARAEAPKVLADIPAVHSLVAQVMQGVGTADILLTQGSDPHDFQLRPSQAHAISQADFIFWIGPELTPWLERAIEGVGIKGEAIELLEVEGTVLRMFGKPEEHSDENAAEPEESGHAEHGHDGIDPHAWLSPVNAAVWLDKIAAELSEIDADNAARYLENANAAKARIVLLDAEINRILAPMKDTPIIVFHDAYGYFSDHYGLIIPGAIRKGDAATPGAAHLVELRQTIAQSGVACAFGEYQHDPALLDAVFADTNVSIRGALDPSGTTLEYGPDLYNTLIRNLATEIAQCQRE